MSDNKLFTKQIQISDHPPVPPLGPRLPEKVSIGFSRWENKLTRNCYRVIVLVLNCMIKKTFLAFAAWDILQLPAWYVLKLGTVCGGNFCGSTYIRFPTWHSVARDIMWISTKKIKKRLKLTRKSPFIFSLINCLWTDMLIITVYRRTKTEALSHVHLYIILSLS
jgi:hypothetical protein